MFLCRYDTMYSDVLLCTVFVSLSIFDIQSFLFKTEEDVVGILPAIAALQRIGEGGARGLILHRLYSIQCIAVCSVNATRDH